jgi:two-component system, OmpR family, sensor histidine kinase KdpD
MTTMNHHDVSGPEETLHQLPPVVSAGPESVGAVASMAPTNCREDTERDIVMEHNTFLKLRWKYWRTILNPVDLTSVSPRPPNRLFGASFHNLITKTLAADQDDRHVGTRYLKGAATVAVITGIGIVLDLRVAPTNLAMLYLLAVVFASFKWGLGPALMSSLISTLAFDYLFIPPYRSFAMTDVWYLITAITLMCVSLLISFLANAVREQATAATRREAQTAALYSLTLSMGGARRPEEVLKSAAAHIKAHFGWDVAFLLSAEIGELVKAFEPPGMNLDAATLAAAEQIFQLAAREGSGPRRGQFQLLTTATGAIGVMVLLPVRSQYRGLDSPILQAVAAQVASSIRRARFEDRAREVEVLRKAEELQRTLLNSVSHSLRAPLAAILSALNPIAEADAGPAIPELARIAQGEAFRLDALIGNLLGMSRLEAGALKVKREPHDIQDVIGSALRELQNPQDRKILVEVQPELPLVWVDFLLIVNVLVNLLDNAIKYSPADLPVNIDASLAGNEIELRVSDRGSGVPIAEREVIFGKFGRGSGTSQTPGIGLGLPISKGFVEAHEGRVWMEDRPGGGSIFCFTLPLFNALHDGSTATIGAP